MSGVAHWINSYFELKDDKAVDKKHPVVQGIKDWVDSEYENGRVVAISVDELVKITDKLTKELKINIT